MKRIQSLLSKRTNANAAKKSASSVTSPPTSPIVSRPLSKHTTPAATTPIAAGTSETKPAMMVKSQSQYSFKVDLLVDEAGEPQQFEEARAKYMERKNAAQQPQTASTAEAMQTLLRALEEWQPQRIAITALEREEIRRMYNLGEKSVEPQPGYFGVPRDWLGRWLADAKMHEPVPLVVGDDDEEPILCYLPRTLWTALLRNCGSVGVWVDGEHTPKPLRVQLKSSQRYALLLVPTTSLVRDVFIRSCATLCESVTARHLELADGSVLDPSSAVGVVLRDAFAAAQALGSNTSDSMPTVFICDDDETKRLTIDTEAGSDDDDDDDDDGGGDSNSVRAIDIGNLTDEEKGNLKAIRSVNVCARELRQVSRSAAATEKALLDVSVVIGDARERLRRARIALAEAPRLND